MIYNPSMEMEKRLRRVGGSVMLPLPPQMLTESGLAAGDVVKLRSRPGHIELEPAEGGDLEVAAFAARFMHRYRDALARLDR
jgi:antitoxin component of MazEF toxin-antitoxin module